MNLSRKLLISKGSTVYTPYGKGTVSDIAGDTYSVMVEDSLKFLDISKLRVISPREENDLLINIIDKLENRFFKKALIELLDKFE